MSVSPHERLLHLMAGLVFEPGVVGLGLQSLCLQKGRHCLGGLLQGDIDDGGLGRPAGELIQQVLITLVGAARTHRQGQIGAKKPGLDMIRPGDVETIANLLCHLRGGRGGQRQHPAHLEFTG